MSFDKPPQINSIIIKGYRPFKNTRFDFENPDIIVGANGSGKSSLFEFFKFLRDSCYRDEIPPEIIQGSTGQEIFHKPGPEKFWWSVEIDLRRGGIPLRFQGELMGPPGKIRVTFEQVITKSPLHKGYDSPYLFLKFREGKGIVSDPIDKKMKRKEWDFKKPNKLALSSITDPTLETLYELRNYIRAWRFYSSFNINNEKNRKSASITEEPVLREDAGNLSAVLFYLMTEHPMIFQELQSDIHSVIPGFKSLNVKARGGPGQVMAFWSEKGFEDELTLADLSDGTLRYICWATLFLHPNPPTLICIDEPDQGVHPRTLPKIASLIEGAAERTQIITATHSSYFLMQFDIENISVMKKIMGECLYFKPANNKALISNLEEFGKNELEIMHRNDEMEALM